jgi:hypothetical protein
MAASAVLVVVDLAPVGTVDDGSGEVNASGFGTNDEHSIVVAMATVDGAGTRGALLGLVEPTGGGESAAVDPRGSCLDDLVFFFDSGGSSPIEVSGGTAPIDADTAPFAERFLESFELVRFNPPSLVA